MPLKWVNARRVAFVALVVLALAVVPAAAAGGKERVGSRINLFDGAFQVFPAGQPFHVAHGWSLQPDVTDYDALGKWGFSLNVDGVDRSYDFVDKFHQEIAPWGILQSRFWVHNFPDGLTGTHRLTGQWFGPCQGVVDAGYPVGPCEKPTTSTNIAPLTATVAFVPMPAAPNLALGKPATASSALAANPPSLAVDGNFWSYWNSGSYAPQWIEVDLGATYTLGQVVLSITQLPDSQTVHRVYGKAAPSDAYQLLHEFAGYTRDLDALSFEPTSPQQVRFVRVETTSSASWIAWREIAVYAAD